MPRARQLGRVDVQWHGLAVDRSAEAGIGMAAQAIAVGHAFGVEDLADLVRLVAVHARRDQVRLLLP